MESRYTSGGVVRRLRPLAGACRYYPYTVVTVSGKQEMKNELVQLGVELSLYVSQSMFLLCDDIRTMLGFCFKLCRGVLPHCSPMLEKLLLVMHYVYLKEIKPKNGVFRDGGSSVQWELIRTTWKEFGDAIIVLDHLSMVLRRKASSFEYRLLSLAIRKYKLDELKKLEDKLRPANDVSKANGFARETVKSVIFDFWRSLFDQEAMSKEIRIGILDDLFTPLFGKLERELSEIRALPVCSPYILGKDFAMQELKHEVVQLGVEFSLYVAQSMFLLCDDIRTMLGFCCKLRRAVLPRRNPVLERLLLVIHYVYSKEIKPKNGVFRDDGNSVQWELIRTTWKEFSKGIIVLHRLDVELRRIVSSFDDRQLLSAIEKYKLQVLKKLDDKLRPAKEVLEANGFARETIKRIIFYLWRSLFDEKAISKERRRRILGDLFTPVWGKPKHSEIRLLRACSPYILGKNFAMQEVKEEVVRLGVELSLYVAESMFVLCDDVRTMLLYCHNIWGDVQRDAINEIHVTDRLLRVMHHVYLKYIKPKKGVYQNDGKNSAHGKVVRPTMDHLTFGFRELDRVVLLLRGGGTCGRELTSVIEEAVKKVEEMLWCVKVVSEVNGFARDVVESNILKLWRSLFDEEAKETTSTLKEIKNGIIRQLFFHIYIEAVAH